MSTDPPHSVVNALGRAHAWKKLYATDVSVFPDSGGGR